MSPKPSNIFESNNWRALQVERAFGGNVNRAEITRTMCAGSEEIKFSTGMKKLRNHC
jgi:hypothetical protein